MDLQEIQTNVSSHVKVLYKLQQRDVFYYHNIEHAFLMIEAAQELAKHEKLNEYGKFVLETAIWFYNTGYLFEGDYKAVAMLANDFLEQQLVSDDLTREICYLIIAVQKQLHSGFMEAIMYDTISFDFADPTFLTRNTQLRLEKAALGHKFRTDKDWLQEIIRPIESHRYYTGYALSNWNERKKSNLKALHEKLHLLG